MGEQSMSASIPGVSRIKSSHHPVKTKGIDLRARGGKRARSDKTETVYSYLDEDLALLRLRLVDLANVEARGGSGLAFDLDGTPRERVVSGRTRRGVVV